jgi:ApeA N-terminal domain 1
MTSQEKEIQTGKFHISPSKSVFGELVLAREKSCLNLWSESVIHTDAENNKTIKGMLHGAKKVTLIDCFVLGTGRHNIHDKDVEQFNVQIFPHYAVIGDGYIDPEQEEVHELEFVISDAATLFLITAHLVR